MELTKSALPVFPYLVVGLGNPGSRYDHTLHNVGFAVVDELARRWAADKFQSKFQGLIATCVLNSEKLWLLKPQTYMNLSGDSVGEAVHFYKLEPDKSLLVISDDLDLAQGRLRLRSAGGSGGHNGLKSIIEKLGTEDFARLRVGIGRPLGSDVKDFVLSKVGKADQERWEDTVRVAADCVECYLKEGLEKAMEKFNRKLNTSSSTTGEGSHS